VGRVVDVRHTPVREDGDETGTSTPANLVDIAVDKPLPNAWDDAEEWDPTWESPSMAAAVDRTDSATSTARDGDDLEQAVVMEFRSPQRKGGETLAKLWTGLFLVYTGAAVPLLTWAIASIVQ
jgi:hypothetical protein